jgi:L-2-hydroxyglutarate oxidase LhgO
MIAASGGSCDPQALCCSLNIPAKCQEKEIWAMSEEKTFFDKNMEMWEKWTGTYMDTMSRAMEKTMEQSAALRKQVDKAVATAVGTQLEATLAGLKALERQVEILSSKIDEMLQREE